MSVIPAPIWEPVKIVYGVYALRGSHAGDDRWWVQRMIEHESNWMVHSDIYLDQPEKRYVTLDVEMSEGWGWLYFNLRDDRGTLLAAEVEGERLVVERNFVESVFPFDGETELDFLSPFMNSLTLRRLQLQPGQSVTRPVVWFHADTFEPRLTRQSYTRHEDTEIELDGERLRAQQVHFHNHDSGDECTLLVRDDGLVLRYPALAELAFDERASAGRGRMPPLGAERGGSRPLD